MSADGSPDPTSLASGEEATVPPWPRGVALVVIGSLTPAVILALVRSTLAPAEPAASISRGRPRSA